MRTDHTGNESRAKKSGKMSKGTVMTGVVTRSARRRSREISVEQIEDNDNNGMSERRVRMLQYWQKKTRHPSQLSTVNCQLSTVNF